jgi:hypothetical protein
MKMKTMALQVPSERLVKARRLFTLLLLLFMMQTGHAQSDTQHLVVWQKGGQKVYFDLAEEPRTTFENGLLVITTNTVQTTYQLSNIIRYTYEGHIPHIGPTGINSRDVVFRQGNDQMAFDGLPDGTTLEVYSLDGKKLFTKQALGGQRTVLSLASHPAGTYVVKVGDATYKFLKR